MSAIDPNDGGYSSRKLIFAAATQILIFVGAILSWKWGLIGANYETMVGGLLGALAIFVSGNVGAKFAIGKNLAGLMGKVGIRVTNNDDGPGQP